MLHLQDTHLKATNFATAHVRGLPRAKVPKLPDLDHHLHEEDSKAIAALSAETLELEMKGEVPMAHRALVT